jgi:NADPH:quinone reductase-like Zn-dependent oxidoreductase
MRALRFSSFGSLDSLAVESVADPVATEGDLVVRVAAASLNPSDAKNVLGKMEGTTLPRTPGRDFAGTVIDGPTALIGKEVWGTGGDIGFTRDGSHAEQIRVPVQGVAPKPANLSMAEAACVGVNYVTAWIGIQALKLAADDLILITGAAGGVGSAVIQLARWLGARVVAVDRTASAQESVRSLGAEFAVTLKPDDPAGLVAEVGRVTGGARVSAVFDCVGGALFEPALQCLGQDGWQVNITSVGGRRVSFDLIDFYHRRLTLTGVDSRSLDTVRCASILERLRPGFESGQLRPSVIQRSFRLEEARSAYELVDSGQLRGKAVFDLS